MTKLANPIPLFLDGRGELLDAGYIYIGAANTDPEIQANHLPLFWDKDRTIPASQPLRTLGGAIANSGDQGMIFLAEDDYSLVVRDVNGVLVTSVASTGEAAGADFQPLDADLTAIAALATTAYGRSLLTLANQAALKAATGFADSLALTGGTMSGNITRGGGGVHAYFADAAMTGGRIFITAAGAADPTSQPGDLWFTY